jgi:hypothetical protein
MRPLVSLSLFLLLQRGAMAQSIPEAQIALSSYIGGGGDGYTLDSAQAVARGGDGSIYIAGYTGSRPFPYANRIGDAVDGDGSFVVKLSPDGRRIEYSTYLGSIFVRALAVDQNGAAYLTGETGGYAPRPSSAQVEFGGNYDAFVAKLSAGGASLDYFTYLGGAQLELGQAIGVDADGNAYVTGWTTSTNFPATQGAAQRQPGGRYDAFAAKLNPDGSAFTYATYLGGAGLDRGATLAIDTQRRLLIAGRTTSSNFVSQVSPTLMGTAPERADAYIARLSSDGSSVERLTLVGGEGADSASRIAITQSGSVVILGNTTSLQWPVTADTLQSTNRGEGDLFVTRLNPDLTAIEASTYFGSPATDTASRLQYLSGFLLDGEPAGDGNFEIESGGLALTSDGGILVAATSWSSGWPDSNTSGGGNTEALVARLRSDLTAADWVLLQGGRDYDSALSVASDGSGGAWVVGEAGRPINPPYFPTTSGAIQADFGGGVGDGFMALIRRMPAASPANDFFASAFTLTGTRVTTIAANSGSTREAGEPLHADVSGGGSVWWRWTAPANGFLALNTAGSDFDTVLAAYLGAAVTTLNSISYNDDSPGGDVSSSTRFPVTAGQTYLIAVDGKSGATGRIVLNLRFSGPQNDDFSDRTILTGFPASTSGSTTNATAETGDDLRNAGSPGGSSVWWEWTATTSGPVAVSLTGSIYQQALAVFTGSSFEELVLLQADISSNNPLGEYAREVTFQAVAGNRYVIGLDGYYAGTGRYELNIEPGVPPSNDDFENRIPLTGLFAQTIASNRRATFQRTAGEPSLIITNSLGEPQSPAADSTVWWTWTAPESGRARISVTNASFDSRVSAYTGGSLSSLTRVAANDGPGDDRSSAVSFEATGGTAYQIQVDGGTYNGRVGGFTLTVLLDHPPKILPGSTRLETGGELSFEVEVVPGRPVTLESSADLRTWSPISTSTPAEARYRITAPRVESDRRMFRLNSPSAP